MSEISAAAYAEIIDGPTPPVNVRVEYPDGRLLPVDCVYEGIVDGLHSWRVVLEPVPLGAGEQLRLVGGLPPRTEVVLSVTPRLD